VVHSSTKSPLGLQGSAAAHLYLPQQLSDSVINQGCGCGERERGRAALPAAVAIAVGVVAIATLAVLVTADGVNGNDGLLRRKEGRSEEGKRFFVGHTASMFTTEGLSARVGVL
jgi:hypothetical protein